MYRNRTAADIGWVVYALAGLCVVLIAVFTVGLQAMKAASSNPAKSLKAD
ncbi:MAG TPA: hypothetical protein VK616_11860 [Flavitalea sp.]|nr:hypothetical protein [Flavitalea sp.]